MFIQASKKETKLRFALTGPSGAGKTWTALTIATTFGGKIAVVDTENKSASKYADQFRFDVLDLEPPYHPSRYVEAIQTAQVMGYRTIILDSLSHAWSGTGGILDIVNDITEHSPSKNSYFAWNEGTRLYKELIDAIVQSAIHVIGTIRSKQEYVLERDDNGKVKPKRVGTAPVQRKGFEYEFDLVIDMDLKNTATVTKTRCPDLPMGMCIPKPGAALGRTMMTWLIGAEWTDALDEKAVRYAAEQWNCERADAYRRIHQAVLNEGLSPVMPKHEFKDFVLALAGSTAR